MTLNDQQKELKVKAAQFACNYANQLYAQSGGRVVPTIKDVERWERDYIERETHDND